jgi:phosphomevalonate kinase
MNAEFTSRAPGKILWLGGYSVLERPNISFVTAVDSYVTASVSLSEDNSVVLDAPQLNAKVTGVIDTSSGALSIEVPKELLLLKTSVEVAGRYAASLGMKPKGIRVRTQNDSAFSYTITGGKIAKSGLGSSAAVTVASAAAVLKAYGVNASQDDALHKIAQIAHSIATGKVGSGFDIAAAAHGTILYTRYSPDLVKSFPATYQNSDLSGLIKKKWDYAIERFSMPKMFKMLFANFVGESMITTAAVGSVSKFKEKDPQKYKELVDGINVENQAAAKALRAINSNTDVKGNLQAFKDAFNKGRLLTKQLGVLSNVSVEDDDLTRLIDESTSNGAFVAKLPGAGGRDSIAALTLDQQSYEKLNNFWRSRKELGILGIRMVESGAMQ